MHNLLLGLILIILIIGFFPGLAIVALWTIGGLLVLGLIGFIISRIISFFKNLFFSLDAFADYCHYSSWKTASLMWLKVAIILATIGVIAVLLIRFGPAFVHVVSLLPDLWTRGIIEINGSMDRVRDPRLRIFITAIPLLYIMIIYGLINFIFYMVKEIKNTISPDTYKHEEDHEKTDL